jgi:hypothetical protein
MVVVGAVMANSVYELSSPRMEIRMHRSFCIDRYGFWETGGHRCTCRSVSADAVKLRAIAPTFSLATLVSSAPAQTTAAVLPGEDLRKLRFLAIRVVVATISGHA